MVECHFRLVMKLKEVLIKCRLSPTSTLFSLSFTRRMNIITDSHKQTMEQFKQNPRDRKATSKNPTQVYKQHSKYESDSVLKSGILQMSPEEVENVETGNRATKLVSNAFRALLVVGASYVLFTLGISLLQKDKKYLLEEGEDAKALKPKTKISSKKTISDYVKNKLS